MELIERLRNLRVILKSGDYDGADLMHAWCTMMDAADLIESLQSDKERMRDIIKAAICSLRNYGYPESASMLEHELASCTTTDEATGR